MDATLRRASCERAEYKTVTGTSEHGSAGRRVMGGEERSKNAQKQRGTRAATEVEKRMKSTPHQCGALHR